MESRIIACSENVGRQHSSGEHGKTLHVHNPNGLNVRFVQVDNCLFRNETKKCDCMYEVLSPTKSIDRAIYVEFKGTNFNHGIEQLEATIAMLKNRHENVHSKRAILIGRRIPRVETTVQKTKVMFLKKYGTVFCPRTNSHKETL